MNKIPHFRFANRKNGLYEVFNFQNCKVYVDCFIVIGWKENFGFWFGLSIVLCFQLNLDCKVIFLRFSVHKYFLGEPLPPHLSPFMEETRRIGDYVPPEETKLGAEEEEEKEEEKESDEVDEDDDEEEGSSDEEEEEDSDVDDDEEEEEGEDEEDKMKVK